MKLKKYLWKGEKWFLREREKKNDLSPIDVLRKRNRKESSEKERERERELTVEHQSSMNCDWRKAPHSNRVNRHRSKALYYPMDSRVRKSLSRSWSFDEGARNGVTSSADTSGSTLSKTTERGTDRRRSFSGVRRGVLTVQGANIDWV